MLFTSTMDTLTLQVNEYRRCSVTFFTNIKFEMFWIMLPQYLGFCLCLK